MRTPRQDQRRRMILQELRVIELTHRKWGAGWRGDRKPDALSERCETLATMRELLARVRKAERYSCTVSPTWWRVICSPVSRWPIFINRFGMRVMQVIAVILILTHKIKYRITPEVS